MAELTIVLNELCSFCGHAKEEHYAPGYGCVASRMVTNYTARCVCLKYLGTDLKYFLAPLEERSTYVP